MKIMKAEIKNYKSLRHVEIEFGNLTILIGKNSSGKSNFIEALYLFFHDFDSEYERDVIEVSELLWYNRETEHPIEFVITVKLDEKEYNNIFSENIPENIRKEFGTGLLTICREISFNPPSTATWKTSYVALDDAKIIEDNELIRMLSPIKIVKKQTSEEMTSAIDLSETEKTVVVPARHPDELITIKKIYTSISQIFQKSFYLFPTVRNNVSNMPSLGDRSEPIPSEILNAMVVTEQSERQKDVRIWSKILEDFNEIPSLNELKVRSGNQMRCKEGYNYFPLSYIGGGDQEVMALTFLLRSVEVSILAIEEPETHLHSTLSRIFFKILKGVCENKQIIISTHSSIFIDTLNLDYAWIFRKEGLETNQYRIQKAENLNIVSYELGIRPSDIFFADRILFVEGSIDKNVYRIWAEKKGIDLISPKISVIPLRGSSKGNRHLKAWNEVTKSIPVSFYIILDNDAKSQGDKLIEEGLIESRQISILEKGTIEDYYDVDILMKIMTERYDNEFTEKDMQPTISKGLMKFLKRKHRALENFLRAKAEVAEEVANATPKDKIDDEIIRILERTEIYLGL